MKLYAAVFVSRCFQSSLSICSKLLHCPQMPLVQACFEGNVVQLQELIGQREDVNAQVGACTSLHEDCI